MRSAVSDCPAYRIETERLVLRCWSPTDAVRVRASLDRSANHLRPFIPFMKDEPRSLADTVVWLRSHRASFDRDEHYRYPIFNARETSLLGEVMLLNRHGTGELELGYWIDRQHAGNGYATEAGAAVTKVAFELHRVDRVEIHCSPDNAPSATVAVKLGYQHEATLRRRHIDTEGRVGDSMIWSMFAAQYPESTASQIGLRTFNCLGTRWGGRHPPQLASSS